MDFAEEGSSEGLFLADVLDGLRMLNCEVEHSPSRADEIEGGMLRALPQRSQLALHVVATELFSRVRLHAPKAYEKTAGIPACHVVLSAAVPANDKQVTFPALDAVGYSSEYKPIVPTKDPEEKRTIRTESGDPELRFLLSIDRVLHLDAGDIEKAWSPFMLDVVTHVTSLICHGLKHRLQVPRAPVSGKPVVPIPKYTSFPGGHATLAYCLTEVLGTVLGSNPKAHLRTLAGAVSKRRQSAGLHVDYDTTHGETLGTAIGGWLVGLVDAQAPDANGKPLALACPGWTAVYKLAAAGLSA